MTPYTLGVLIFALAIAAICIACTVGFVREQRASRRAAMDLHPSNQLPGSLTEFIESWPSPTTNPIYRKDAS